MGNANTKIRVKLSRALPHNLGNCSARDTLMDNVILLLTTSPATHNILTDPNGSYDFSYFVATQPTQHLVVITLLDKGTFVYKIEASVDGTLDKTDGEFRKKACAALDDVVTELLRKRLEGVPSAVQGGQGLQYEGVNRAAEEIVVTGQEMTGGNGGVTTSDVKKGMEDGGPPKYEEVHRQ